MPLIYVLVQEEEFGASTEIVGVFSAKEKALEKKNEIEKKGFEYAIYKAEVDGEIL